MGRQDRQKSIFKRELKAGHQDLEELLRNDEEVCGCVWVVFQY